jgi:8-oxo-dGTP diphosphatase
MTLIQSIAAKAIIVDGRGRALVLKQSDEEGVSYAGRYHAPGGMVEPGESLHDALRREVLEETGLKVRIDNLLTVAEWPAHIRGQDYQCFGVFYLCLVDGRTEVAHSEEHGDSAWVTAKEAATMDILSSAKELIQQVLGQTGVQ